MPRGTRIIVDNACYHVVNRGNQKQNIFLEDADYVKFLEILKFYKRKFWFKIYGYCLMPNHIHLLVQPKLPNDLRTFMQGLTQTYTIWFNKKYKKVGHLWQGRFKNMVVVKDEYFLNCVYYVEMNPLRKDIVNTPGDYLWSSYHSRIFGNKDGLLDLPDST